MPKGWTSSLLASILTIAAWATSACDDDADRTDRGAREADAGGDGGGPAVGRAEDAGGARDGGAPSIAVLCQASCGRAASAGCAAFDESGCLSECESLGFYFVTYLGCYEEFRTAKECEAEMDYACPDTVDSGACATEQQALLNCS